MMEHHADGEELLGLVMDAHSDYRRGKETIVEAAIRGGGHLLTAKEQLPHSDFLPFLERAGLEPRTAQRWMALARTGWKCDTVSLLGGIGQALKFHKRNPDIVLDADALYIHRMEASQAALEKAAADMEALAVLDPQALVRHLPALRKMEMMLQARYGEEALPPGGR